jgi:hypothetical protein
VTSGQVFALLAMVGIGIGAGELIYTGIIHHFNHKVIPTCAPRIDIAELTRQMERTIR